MKSIRDYISQSENSLICKDKCNITIDLNEYDIGNNLIINEEEVSVESLICSIEFSDFMFNLVLDYPVILPIQNIEIVENEYIKLSYTKNSIILETSLDTKQIKEQVGYVERLLGGREIFKDVDHLFNKLFKVYGGKVSDMDLVHLEILLSQCLRDKKDPSKPARLGATWNPIMMNIKTAIFSTSFMQGLSFENINEAIKTGLVSEVKTEPSIIEKVLTGTLKREEI